MEPPHGEARLLRKTGKHISRRVRLPADCLPFYLYRRLFLYPCLLPGLYRMAPFRFRLASYPPPLFGKRYRFYRIYEYISPQICGYYPRFLSNILFSPVIYLLGGIPNFEFTLGPSVGFNSPFLYFSAASLTVPDIPVTTSIPADCNV